ncbi:hypothetical protein AVEN_96884-1 [Araneus ventricosus]|uniref:Uncharacterized protein n=1 Tax=Araneus ventricosus TaxID=182803 RepID=A0A4Y2ISP1_ARAVE|nr:hypothetical protein AVEN_96884-1 [Araneus ventricosus]
MKTRSEEFHEGHKHRETLLHKYVAFECKKEHIHKQSSAKGIRPNVKTGKLGCNFKLKLSTSDCFLNVKESILEHCNHKVSEERFGHLPEKLRLNAEEIKDAELSIKSGGNKKKFKLILWSREEENL